MEYKKEDGRIYIEKEGKVVAEIEYEDMGNNEFNIYHTFVDDNLRGQQIASKLVEMAVEEIEKRRGKVSATCSYAKAWLERHKLV